MITLFQVRLEVVSNCIQSARLETCFLYDRLGNAWVLQDLDPVSISGISLLTNTHMLSEVLVHLED
jgi:hypothetical protein